MGKFISYIKESNCDSPVFKLDLLRGAGQDWGQERMNLKRIILCVLIIGGSACASTTETRILTAIDYDRHQIRTKYDLCVDKKCNIQIYLKKDSTDLASDTVYLGVGVYKKTSFFKESWGTALIPGVAGVEGRQYHVAVDRAHLNIDGIELVLEKVGRSAYFVTTEDVIKKIVSAEKATIRIELDEELKKTLNVDVDYYKSNFKNGDAELGLKQYLDIVE